VVTMQNGDFTDHLPFDAVGIPAFQFIQDELDYENHTWHSSMDVYDHLEEDDLKQASVVVATFLYHAAMRPERLPRKFLP
jgi:Zn-dependent M28 family amino/carboxypeptidase